MAIEVKAINLKELSNMMAIDVAEVKVGNGKAVQTELSEHLE